jgi:hypothetical protein
MKYETISYLYLYYINLQGNFCSILAEDDITNDPDFQLPLEESVGTPDITLEEETPNDSKIPSIYNFSLNFLGPKIKQFEFLFESSNVQIYGRMYKLNSSKIRNFSVH